MILLAAVTAIGWFVILLSFLYRISMFAHLPQAARADRPAADRDLPMVSVILAAKEEEASIAETIRHLLRQDYPRYEIIAVNDRSSDRTGVKLDELKRWSADLGASGVRMQVVHVTTLPEGWLGKNHALYQGVQQAKGRLLLFTDADVRFAPSAISDAVRYMREQAADHVTVAPNMIGKSVWLRAFVHYFLFSLAMFTMPWLANDDRRRNRGIGIGAFNLMTRAAYERIGTHRAFALRPDDDLQLGKRVKQAGLTQRFVSGVRQLEVEWYPDLPAAIRGLEKNFYSGFGYRLSAASAAAAGQLLFFLFPYIGIWFSGGWGALLFGAAILCMFVLYVGMIRAVSSDSGWDVFLFPASAALLVYVLVRAVAMTHARGGINWRGTFYPLSDLKKMK